MQVNSEDLQDMSQEVFKRHFDARPLRMLICDAPGADAAADVGRIPPESAVLGDTKPKPPAGPTPGLQQQVKRIKRLNIGALVKKGVTAGPPPAPADPAKVPGADGSGPR